MYCKMCGKELPDGAARCGECGTPVDSAYEKQPFESGNNGTDNAASYTYGGNSDTQSTDNSYYQDNRSRYQYQQDDSGMGSQPVYEHQSGARKGFAITSLVLGIVGLVGSCCSMMTFGVLNLLLGVVGLIFGILGLKSQSKGMAIAGIIMAALNLVIGVLLLIVMVASLSMTQKMTPEEMEIIFEMMESMEYVDMVQIKGLFVR